MDQESGRRVSVETTWASGEIDIGLLLNTLLREKKVIVFVCTFSLLASIALALYLPNVYRAEAVLVPVSQNSGMSSLASKYGGLASLAGIALPTEGGDKTALGIEVLKSRAFFSKFLESRDILIDLMAVKAWDETSNSVIVDDSVFDSEKNEWVRKVEPPFVPKPSMQESYKVFSKIFSVSQDEELGFVRISIEHVSPVIAKNWVEWLVNDVNEEIRHQDVEQAQRSIDYLKEQVASTSLTELHSGFFKLIQSQTETIMLAKASPEYLFKTIDPAVVPEEKSKPNRLLIVVIGGVLGGVLSVVFVLLKTFFLASSI